MAEPVIWLADGTPASPRFNDRYRSSLQQGRLQAEQVFLAGCGLPQAWRGQSQWRLFENGFGLGLNFLVTWKCWREDSQRPALLHVTATEAFPVGASELLQACQPHPDLLPLAEQLAVQFQGLLPGVHRLVFEDGRLLLTLLIGNADQMLRTLDDRYDSVYLDGFAPDRNPQMWDLALLQALARRCHRGTRLASWTVARPVIEGLRQCGFEVEKVTGVAPKRQNLQAQFNPSWGPRAYRTHRPAARSPKRCTIIGAGLAGAAVASSLRRRGWQITVVEADQPSAGASGLPAGLIAAHMSPDDGPLSRWSRAGLRATWLEAERLLKCGIDYDRSGVLQRRLDSTGALPADWPEAGTYWSGPAPTLAGLDPRWIEGSIWHAQGGWLRPSRLVRAWLTPADIMIKRGRVARLERPDDQWIALDAWGQEISRSELVVLANAGDCARLLATLGLTLPSWQLVRGQVSWAQVLEGDELPPVPVNGHGSLIPRFPDDRGQACWQMGATFDRDQTDLKPRPESHLDNLAKLEQLLPSVAPSLAGRQVQSWVGLRCAFRDHLPLIGPPDENLWPGLWLSTAFGSRGLTGSALAAELIAAWLHDEPLPVESRLARAVQAGRAARKP